MYQILLAVFDNSVDFRLRCRFQYAALRGSLHAFKLQVSLDLVLLSNSCEDYLSFQVKGNKLVRELPVIPSNRYPERVD